MISIINSVSTNMWNMVTVSPSASELRRWKMFFCFCGTLSSLLLTLWILNDTTLSFYPISHLCERLSNVVYKLLSNGTKHVLRGHSDLQPLGSKIKISLFSRRNFLMVFLRYHVPETEMDIPTENIMLLRRCKNQFWVVSITYINSRIKLSVCSNK